MISENTQKIIEEGKFPCHVFRKDIGSLLLLDAFDL